MLGVTVWLQGLDIQSRLFPFGAATQRGSALSVVVFKTTHAAAPERTRPGLGIIEPCLPSPSKGG